MEDEELTSPGFNQTESDLEDGHPELWNYDTRFEFVVHGLLISFMGSLGLLGKDLNNQVLHTCVYSIAELLTSNTLG